MLLNNSIAIHVKTTAVILQYYPILNHSCNIATVSRPLKTKLLISELDSGSLSDFASQPIILRRSRSSSPVSVAAPDSRSNSETSYSRPKPSSECPLSRTGWRTRTRGCQKVNFKDFNGYSGQFLNVGTIVIAPLN